MNVRRHYSDAIPRHALFVITRTRIVQFQLIICTGDTLQEVPSAVKRLGTKPSQFALALIRLSDAGSGEAKSRLCALRRAARRYEGLPAPNALKAIERDNTVPIDLHRSARWMLDAAGLFALQLVLWFWHAQRTPSRYGIYGTVAAGLPPFDSDTAKRWWKLGHDALIRTYPKPEKVPELVALVKARSCRRSAVRTRNYILRKLRERLLGFAPPPVSYRS